VYQDFQNKKNLVIGDVMVDAFIETSLEKTSPEYADTPVLKIREKHIFLGGAANVAHNIKTLGAVPYLVGVVGNDANTSVFYSLLESNNIDKNFVIQSDITTTAKSRIFRDGVPVMRLDDETSGNYNPALNQQILDNVLSIIEKHIPDAIILQDYNKGVLNGTTIPLILQMAQQKNIPVFVDPKFANWNLYKNVRCFKPNKIEFEAIVQELSIPALPLEEQLLYVKNYLEAENIFVTLGNQGNIMIDNENNITASPIYQTIVNADVCGAGDSVIAMLCLSFLTNNTPAATARLANIAGYIACNQPFIHAVTFDG
jgi:rfaE bifunctional protein kinase chain/domain